jgi:hypothetical protein
VSSTDDDPAGIDPYDADGWLGGQVLISRANLRPPEPWPTPAELERVRAWLAREG